ncbi:hypothetical protein BESB_066240 [Besnoitia besnoiti]|uniref:Uncharacterized protein n=1 Tax=Besnoitia besnoiti TaxID=94643 RepID=A0A2A9ME93_BESBE|nr:hypothetical protein BESB_066240 [Besnoitia besnoiti]PFH34591.1 hypothetical protein BESB_066240 [Besnoitia besnoiti]
MRTASKAGNGIAVRHLLSLVPEFLAQRAKATASMPPPCLWFSTAFLSPRGPLWGSLYRRNEALKTVLVVGVLALASSALDWLPSRLHSAAYIVTADAASHRQPSGARAPVPFDEKDNYDASGSFSHTARDEMPRVSPQPRRDQKAATPEGRRQRRGPITGRRSGEFFTGVASSRVSDSWIDSRHKRRNARPTLDEETSASESGIKSELVADAASYPLSPRFPAASLRSAPGDRLGRKPQAGATREISTEALSAEDDTPSGDEGAAITPSQGWRLHQRYLRFHRTALNTEARWKIALLICAIALQVVDAYIYRYRDYYDEMIMRQAGGRQGLGTFLHRLFHHPVVFYFFLGRNIMFVYDLLRWLIGYRSGEYAPPVPLNTRQPRRHAADGHKEMERGSHLEGTGNPLQRGDAPPDGSSCCESESSGGQRETPTRTVDAEEDAVSSSRRTGKSKVDGLREVASQAKGEENATAGINKLDVPQQL